MVLSVNSVSSNSENDDDSQIFLYVSVKSPITHQTWEDGQYTTYAVNVQTNNVIFSSPVSSVRRRYSEFVWLRKMLKIHHPSIDPPSLPPKTLFVNRFCPSFIEERRRGLEEFLEKVFMIQIYLSNKCIHLFLQSTLTMKDIEILVSDKAVKSKENLSVTDSVNASVKNPDDTCLSDYSSECTEPDYSEYDVVDFSSPLGSPLCIREECNQTSVTHSHVTLGSRITICTPTLVVPDSSDLDYDFFPSQACSVPDISTNKFSPPGMIRLLHSNMSEPCLSNTAVKFPAASCLSSRSLSRSLSKKKVSFSDNVTIATI